MSQDNFWGELVVKLREEMKLSQRALATKAQMCRSTLRRIENGQTSGDMAVMERIFDCLGYELEAMEKITVSERKRRLAEIEEMSTPNRSKLAARRILLMSTALTRSEYK